MADFFTRVAEQALGLTPTVQPVIAPLFAPSALEGSQRAAPDRSLVMEEISAPGLSADMGASRPAAPSPLLAFQPLVDARAVPAAETTFPRPPAAAPGAGEQTVRRTFQPLLAPTAGQAGADLQTARLFSTGEQAGGHRSPVPRIEPREQRGTAPLAAQDPRGDAPEGQRASRAGVERVETRQAEARAVAPMYTKPVAAARVQEAALPPIHVSIGRIEVRALHPPAPAPARPQLARPAPALSLDAYLQQQKGKQR